MKTWLVLALTIAAVGCSSTNVELMKSFEPRPEDWPIEILYGRSVPGDIVNAYPGGRLGEPRKDAIPVALIEVEKLVSSGWTDVIRDARNQARDLGGDGIFLNYERKSMFGGDNLRILVFRKR